MLSITRRMTISCSGRGALRDASRSSCALAEQSFVATNQRGYRSTGVTNGRMRLTAAPFSSPARCSGGPLEEKRAVDSRLTRNLGTVLISLFLSLFRCN
jgi:hypothetical protein